MIKAQVCFYGNLKIVNSKKIINTDLAPKAIGAYSQAVEFNDFFSPQDKFQLILKLIN